MNTLMIMHVFFIRSQLSFLHMNIPSHMYPWCLSASSCWRYLLPTGMNIKQIKNCVHVWIKVVYKSYTQANTHTPCIAYNITNLKNKST